MWSTSFLVLALTLSTALAGVDAHGLQNLRDPDSEVRRRALTALARDPQFHDPSVIPYLIETLVRDKDFTLQEKAAVLLAEHPGPGAALGLVRVLETRETSAGHTAAALGLSRVQKPFVIEPLLTALQAKAERTRKFALEGLAPFLATDPRIPAAFLTVATSDDDLLNNQFAARALIKAGDPAHRSLLVASLRDSKNLGRAPIALELGKAQVALAIPYLTQLLRAPQKELQLAGMKALMSFSTPTVRATVREFFATPGIDPVARDYAVEYLALAGDAKSLELFRALLADPSERSTIKRFAILGLRASVESADLHTLVQLLSAEDKFLRQEALKSLKTMLVDRPEYAGLLDVLLNYKI